MAYEMPLWRSEAAMLPPDAPLTTDALRFEIQDIMRRNQDNFHTLTLRKMKEELERRLNRSVKKEKKRW